MSESEEAVKILGHAGFKIRRLGQRMYLVERKCSTTQLMKLACKATNGLGNVSRETTDGKS